MDEQIKPSSAANDSAPVVGSQTGFSPVSFSEVGTSGESNDEKAIQAKAKLLEPACATLSNILDSINFRLACHQVSQVESDNDVVEEMSSEVRLSKESKEAFKQAAARIAARRCKTSETIDWTVITGVFGEMAAGYLALSVTVKKIAAQNNAKRETKGKTS